SFLVRWYRPMPTTTAAFIVQAAAIPVRSGQVCLVTSSSGKRWVVPKGLIDPGKTAAEIALQEAWEEAGLVGVLDRDPVGSYLYDKYGGTCHVTVFMMHVTEAADSWPEQNVRQRNWFKLPHALERIEDRGLREVVRFALKDD